MWRNPVRILGLVALAAVFAVWLALGADRGWTKTSVATMHTDEVTGIDYPVIENRFVPGIDFLALGSLGAFALVAVSFFPIPSKP